MPDLQHVRQHIVRQTFREVLPAKFDSTEAVVQLLAIGQQESLFVHRTQVGGPAHGFWQFERAGVRGVLEHKATRAYAIAACAIRDCLPTVEAVYRRVVEDDLLACSFARLNLWWDPKPLPAPGQSEAAFSLYIRTWRPGAYDRGTSADRAKLRAKWERNYLAAMEALA
jgi:hypothetical protein